MRTVASAQHILATAVSGWSPNSAAVRAAAPLLPSRRSVVATAPRTWSGEVDPEGCRVEANSASARTASNVPAFSLRASDVLVAGIPAMALASHPSTFAATGFAPHVPSCAVGSSYVFAASLQPAYRPPGIGDTRQQYGRAGSASVAPQGKLDAKQRPLARRAADLELHHPGELVRDPADLVSSSGRPTGSRDCATRRSRPSETRRCWGLVR